MASSGVRADSRIGEDMRRYAGIRALIKAGECSIKRGSVKTGPMRRSEAADVFWTRGDAVSW
jgi:hypothetical protein